MSSQAVMMREEFGSDFQISEPMTREEYGSAFQRGFPFTVRFLGLQGLPREIAEEAAQAAWAKGWERIHQLRDPSRVLAWVGCIALNTCWKMLRRSNRNVALPEIAVAPAINHAALDLKCLLGKCDDKQRELLENYHLQGMEVGELAKRHLCSMTAVRIRLMRARKAAAQTLSPRPSRKALKRRKESSREQSLSPVLS